MSTRSKRWFGFKLLKKATLPFRFIGQKAKAEMQRFVIKTVEKQGGLQANATPAGGAHATELILRMLRNRAEVDSQRAMPAVPVGDQLLTKHPSGLYFYHRPDPHKLEETPAILDGNYEVAVSAWLHAHVDRSTNVLLIGSTDGFHELTLASKLSSLKQLVIVQDVESRDQIELNLRTNGYEANELLALISLKAFLQSSLVDSFSPNIVVVREIYSELIPHVQNAFPEAVVASVVNGTVKLLKEHVVNQSNESARRVA